MNRDSIMPEIDVLCFFLFFYSCVKVSKRVKSRNDQLARETMLIPHPLTCYLRYSAQCLIFILNNAQHFKTFSLGLLVPYNFWRRLTTSISTVCYCYTSSHRNQLDKFVVTAGLPDAFKYMYRARHYEAISSPTSGLNLILKKH